MYSSVLVAVDVVEVNVIMGAGMGPLVVDAVVEDGFMGLGINSLVSCFAVKSNNLAAVEVFEGLCPGAGNAGSMKREPCSGQRFSAQPIFLVPSQNTQMWPKPRFSGREPGFGPDVVIFNCKPFKTTKNYHIWPKPMVLGPEPWVWARCGPF